MQHQKTVTIKGIVYDIESGKPVAQKPVSVQQHQITKFAPQTAPKKVIVNDVAPTQHPFVKKAHEQQRATREERIVKPSSVLKQEAIATAMEKAQSHSREQVKQKKHVRPIVRTLQIGFASIAVLALGAYITYLNMPSITTSVAASQAGIHATYPSYTPSGYSLAGPVAYDNGIVTMRFAAAAAPLAYTVSEQQSGWDSSAVQENYVVPAAGQKYTTTEINGLTIYSFNQNAAWVNGGILYTIRGDAPLSPDQVQRIAISL